MKTTELMRFDLVDYNGSVAKIDCIYNDKFIIAIAPFDENCKYAEVKEDEIKRIPLTDEILALNGWNRDSNGAYIKMNCLVSLDSEPFESGYFIPTGLDHIFIDYVHEFQHLLRLCGYGNLADNFKIEEL